MDQLLLKLPDALICLDREWRIILANEEARRIGRIGTEEIGSRTIWEIYPDVVGSVLEQKYRSVMGGGAEERVEFFYAPFGLWLDLHIYSIREGIAIYYRDVTEQKHAEAARERTSAQLQQVYELTSDAIFSLDWDWTFSFANHRAQELLAPVGAMLGDNIWVRFPHAVGSKFYTNYKRTMEERVPTRFETYYPEPLNRWYAVDARPSEDGIVVFFRDVSQQRQDEEALRASEARYRVLADLNPQAIWMGSADGRITYANQRFLDYTGLSLAERGGWIAAFHPEDRTTVVERWREAVGTGNDFDVELRLIRASDGAARWWHFRASPVRNDAGGILYWLGVAMDIHDVRTAAEDLLLKQRETERQRAELEAVYRTAPIGLALFDPVEFRYLRLNDRQAQFFNMPADQILGQTVTEMAPIEGLQELFDQVASGRAVHNQLLEGELATSPGEHRYWTVNYSPVLGMDGSVQAISAASIEITQQKRAEAALLQSEKLAAVGRLASSISHEINNPLEAVTNLLYLIAMSETLPESLKEYVHMAQGEVARVSQIATQTLRFHRQAVRPTHVSAAQLVDAVVHLYQGRLLNSGIKVDAVYATSREILCFENDIRQVLNNLIANAIDAMRNGGRLMVRAHDAIHPGDGRSGIRITIADTGTGMSPETQRRLFEAFYTTKDLNGTGLGLWISSEIVTRHKGRLTLRSSQHPRLHGTVFSLFLPHDELCSPAGSEAR